MNINNGMEAMFSFILINYFSLFSKYKCTWEKSEQTKNQNSDENGKSQMKEIKNENIPLTALILFPIICFATNAAIFIGYVFKFLYWMYL